jgi:hypothetical protein
MRALMELICRTAIANQTDGYDVGALAGSCGSKSPVGKGWIIPIAALVIAACGSTEAPLTTMTQGQTSAAPPTPSTVDSRATATTTVEGLELTGTLWVTIGLDGLRTDSGTLLWSSGNLAEKAVARDGAGGLVFLDGSGLWWFADGASEPVLVARNVPTRVIEVVRSDNDAIVALGYEQRTYLRLSDGMNVEDPGGLVTIDPDGNEIWSAANGWSAWIEGPHLAAALEGTPTVVEKAARLKVTDATGALVIDEVIGTEAEPWVRMHDFDGQIMILSRGPIEPAMPEETFLVIDLGCDTCTSTFTAAGASASLVGSDREWNGPLEFSDASLP